MTPPEHDEELSPYWRGVIDTKLDTVIREMRRLNDSKEAEHARLEARIDGETKRLDGRIDDDRERIDDIESWRDQQQGSQRVLTAIVGTVAKIAGGVVGTVASAVIITSIS